MPRVNIHDIEMYYEARGQGPAALLISGLGTDLANWPVLADELAKSHTVVAFDNRGAGRSSMPAPPYAIEDMASDALALMDHLGLDKAHLVGHSMGGFIAQVMAATAPGRVDRLVLACSSARISARNALLFENWLAMAKGGVSQKILVREVFLWMYPVARFAEPGFLDQVVAESLAYPYQQPLHAFAGQVAAINAFDATALLKDIQAPTLVLSAEHDLVITARETAALVQGIAGAEHAVVPNAGHRANLEHPSQFATPVLDFLPDTVR